VSDVRKVVVVDDTPELLELIASVLTDEGYEVVACQDAVRAAATVVHEAPALVILDLRMAGVGDWQVLDELRADPRTVETPVIICSGAVDELRAAEPTLKARRCEILTKPFDIEVLVQRAKRLIGSHGAED
jgi:CheY-like chemotaxis protein